MKFKNLICVLLLSTMCVGLTGCSKDARECKKTGLAFIEAGLDFDYEGMEEYCRDDEVIDEMRRTADSQFSSIAQRTMDELFEHSDVRVDSVDVGESKVSVTYIITIPNPEDVVHEIGEGSDVDEAVEAVSDTAEYEIELEFVNKHDEWLVSNPHDFFSDFIFELYSDSLTIIPHGGSIDIVDFPSEAVETEQVFETVRETVQ